MDQIRDAQLTCIVKRKIFGTIAAACVTSSLWLSWVEDLPGRVDPPSRAYRYLSSTQSSLESPVYFSFLFITSFPHVAERTGTERRNGTMLSLQFTALRRQLPGSFTSFAGNRIAASEKPPQHYSRSYSCLCRDTIRDTGILVKATTVHQGHAASYRDPR